MVADGESLIFRGVVSKMSMSQWVVLHPYAYEKHSLNLVKAESQGACHSRGEGMERCGKSLGWLQDSDE